MLMQRLASLRERLMGQRLVFSSLAALALGLLGGSTAYSAVTHSGGSSSFRAIRHTCTGWPSGSGLLVDGDFSGARSPGNFYTEWAKGQRFAPAWKVTKRTIDLNGTNFQFPNAVCSIDLDGSEAGAIRHKPFPTTPSA